MADVLHVEKREQTGSTASQRLRQSGKVPAVLYGHGQSNEHLAIPKSEVQLLLRHHSKQVELAGAVTDTALISELHWDPLGIEVLHMDLQRVDLTEKVVVSVAVHIHGEAIGTRNGGIFLESNHQVDIRCSAGSIPEHVVLHVAEMDVGDNRTAGDLELPDGVELVTPENLMIAQVNAPKGVAEDEEEDAGEPEVIGEKKEGADSES